MFKKCQLEFGEELERAYGSNKVAEIAKSAGETQRTFTNIPQTYLLMFKKTY
jgi:hypothetical protein